MHIWAATCVTSNPDPQRQRDLIKIYFPKQVATFFPDPVFQRELVRIDPRGNPIDGFGSYYARRARRRHVVGLLAALWGEETRP